jgi:transcriptional regulator of acetoin/glycerol metabolism
MNSAVFSRGSRRIAGLERPLAAALPLDNAHIDAIEQSHQRCATIGLSRLQSPDFSPQGRADLAITRERNRRLQSHALPVMEMLYEQIVNTQSMVVLTDACGTVIHSIGDDDFLAKASKVALTPGVDWSESAKGTNAIGTTLVAETPTLVYADEHFMHANHFLTCSAAPIFDPRGNILGVIDVTGDHCRYHQHTMGLVKMSARMIENHWLSDDFRNVMRLHLHSRVEFLGTLMEGLLAVSRDGRIVGANRTALDHLGLSGAAVRMHSVTSLFGTSVGALVDHFRQPLAAPLALSLPNGSPCHVRARFNWATWYGLGDPLGPPTAPTAAGEASPASVAVVETRHSATPRAPQPTGRAGGLRFLDTGDAQLKTVIGKLRKVIDRDIPILVLGETGTGKELLARAIHQESERAKMPFVAVNCASIPELLRVLQERQVVPLGGHKPVAVDVALVSATHRDLRAMIEAKIFREDLYYRLNGLVVKMPPLRERSDLQALVARMFGEECSGALPALAPEIVELFQRYHWPGNLRQLANVLRTAAEATITREHLSDDFLDDCERSLGGTRGAAKGASAAPVAVESAAAAAPATGTLEEIEVETIRRAVQAAGGNISEASKRLGISRNTIYRKLRWSAPA